MTLFQVNDRVKLKTGNSLIIIERIKWGILYNKDEQYIYYRYSKSLYLNDRARGPRPGSDFEFFDKLPITQEEKIPMNDLYQTKEDPPRFGTAMEYPTGGLIKNSIGKVLLEMKGSLGAVEAFYENEIEIVMPYTIMLERLGFGEKSGITSIHLIGVPGQVVKEDVLLELNSGLIWRVTQLDSKCQSAKPNKSKWLKLQTTTTTFGEDKSYHNMDMSSPPPML